MLLLGSARFSSLNCALQGNPSRCYSTATFFLPLPRFLLLALLFHLSRVTVGIAISFQKLELGPVSFQGEEIHPAPKMSRAPYLFQADVGGDSVHFLLGVLLVPSLNGLDANWESASHPPYLLFSCKYGCMKVLNLYNAPKRSDVAL